MGKNPAKDPAAEVRAFGEEISDSFAEKITKTRHVIIGILPCVGITSLKQDVVVAKMLFLPC